MTLSPTTPRAPLQHRRAPRILVVEGEEFVRRWLVGVLGRLGFEVTAVRDGTIAMARLAEARDEVDLLLMDWVLPRMGGAELLDALAAEFPGLPVIITTSHGLEPADMTRPNVFRTLRKPVEAETIEAALQRALPEPGDKTPPPVLESGSQPDFVN